MAGIRFIHVDHLRLGSPLEGLADYPEWLRQTLSGAVRRSVSSVAELAVASHCQFVLLAGRMTDQEADLDLATAWMSVWSSQLRRHGIRLGPAIGRGLAHAVGAHPESLALGVGDRVEVTCDTSGSPNLRVLPPHVARRRPDSLLIELDQDGVLETPNFLYRAAPDGVPGRELLQAVPGGSLTVTAGSPQAVSVEECGEHGCRIVEADLEQRTLSARFAATDTVRYAREMLHAVPGMGAVEIVEEMVRRSQSLVPGAGRTTIVDWFLGGPLTVGADRPGGLSENELLRCLRSELQAGHSGVWPRRVRFTETSAFRVVGRSSRAVAEYLSLTSSPGTGSRIGDHGLSRDLTFGCLGGQALPGLEALIRAGQAGREAARPLAAAN